MKAALCVSRCDFRFLRIASFQRIAAVSPAVKQPVFRGEIVSSADSGLMRMFCAGRSYNRFTSDPIPLETIRRAYDLARMGPTSFNCQPMRLLLLTSANAKERLRPALILSNVEKTMSAPVTIIVATDTRFYEHAATFFPHKDIRQHLGGDSAFGCETAFRNSTMQGAYLMMALRALGLDIGPLSGFDREMVDREFFQDGRYKSNWIVNVGRGDPRKLFPRLPRFEFKQIANVL
jgi:3-hydroxypropanoate dehydrogenase